MVDVYRNLGPYINYGYRPGRKHVRLIHHWNDYRHLDGSLFLSERSGIGVYAFGAHLLVKWRPFDWKKAPHL